MNSDGMNTSVHSDDDDDGSQHMHNWKLNDALDFDELCLFARGLLTTLLISKSY